MTAPEPAPTEITNASFTPTPFVARTTALARLNEGRARARQGQGSMLFIAGSTGTGKSALIQAFLAEAAAEDGELLAALGLCDAYTGVGDAYLPLREALTQLMGLADGPVPVAARSEGWWRNLAVDTCQLLVELGPDLLDVFVPFGDLIGKVSSSAVKRMPWYQQLESLRAQGKSMSGIDQGQIFEQYVNVLRKMADKHPLIIVLDDLQWADAASVALLFRLGRRLQDSRILVVGAYRPEEVALSRDGERHPLEKLVAEFQRYLGDICLDLDVMAADESELFINELLDREPNRLRAGFRNALLRHTGGHPLFTIELLQMLKERGDLLQTEDGYWVASSKLNWQRLPTRVEGALAERVDRLSPDLREVLTVASVQGEEFGAEIVADATQSGARELVRTLSGDLQKVHRLVEHVSVTRVGRRRISSYRFAHNLIQRFFYTSLDEAELSYLHEDIGQALVAFYEDAADQVAVQLAWHFEQAGLDDEARHYLRLAGEQATARFANAEAADFYRRALALTPTEEIETRFQLLTALERAWDLLGDRAAQATELAQLAGLAQQMDGEAQMAVGLRQGWLALRQGEHHAAVAAAEQITALADAHQSAPQTDPAQIIEAHLLASQALWQMGQYEPATTHANQALAMARKVNDIRREAQALERLGTIALNQHRADEALDYHTQALTLTQQSGEPRREYSVRNNLGVVAQSQGDHTAARRHYEAVLDLVRRIGDRQGEGIALGNLGEVYRHLGQYARAQSYLTTGLDRARETDDRLGEEIMLGNLAEIALHQDDVAQAQSQATAALALAETLDDRLGQGIAHNLLGECARRQGAFDAATEAFARALAIWDGEDEPQRRLETIAGLAATALDQGDADQALHQAETVMAGLAELPDFVGAEDPLALSVYAICLDVLTATTDPRLAAFHATTQEMLAARAAAIADPHDRYIFQTASPLHRRLYEQRPFSAENAA